MLYDVLTAAGDGLGLVNAGHYAINSLRLEKGYRAWGADISPDDTALEAGLGFAIAWKKSASFFGKAALLEQKQGRLKRLLVTFVLQDPGPVLWGSEPIYRDGQAAGYTTSGSYGHSLGAAVGMGYGPRGLLWGVELPLALSLIMAGVRVASVTTIGLTTVTALIGQGGLGYLIISGIQQFFPTLIIVGAVLSVALAVLVDAGLVALQRAATPWARAGR